MNESIEILLVEDNASDAEMTIYALKKNKITDRMLHVKDGAAALDFLFSEGAYAGCSTGNGLKFILLDLKMPKINGLQMLQRIKADERTKKFPVVILSSSKEYVDIQKCYELGANSYVVKPVDFEAFQKAVSNLGLYWMIFNQQPL